MEQEIKFIALPSSKDLERRLNLDGSDRTDAILQRYKSAQWRIMIAQRKAAVVAAEVLRPSDFRDIQHVYRNAVRVARETFEDQAVAIFSETCTKGL